VGRDRHRAGAWVKGLDEDVRSMHPLVSDGNRYSLYENARNPVEGEKISFLHLRLGWKRI
jgi:hypothetical protein